METVYSRDGTRIAYDRTGEGPVLIHVGGALNDRRSGAPLARLLADRYTVITYDRRGRGDSGDTQPYAVDREIEDLAAVLDAAGGSAAVYGISVGGVLALRAAAAGLPITRLALFEPPFHPGHDDQLTHARAYNTELTGALADGRYADALALFMRYIGMPEEQVRQTRDTLTPELEALAPTLAYDSAVMDEMRGGAMPVNLIRRATVPVLVMCGDDSPVWLHRSARRVAALLPAGTHRILKGQGHDPATDAIASVLAEFLA